MWPLHWILGQIVGLWGAVLCRQKHTSPVALSLLTVNSKLVKGCPDLCPYLSQSCIVSAILAFQLILLVNVAQAG